MPVVSITPATTTAGDLLEYTRSYLLSSHRDLTNRLVSGASAGSATLSFEFPIGGIEPGAFLSIGLETFLVLDSNAGAKTATVIGAQRGSPSEAHLQGDLVYVNPEFTNFAIFREINTELRAVSSPGGLFQVATVEVTYDAALVGFDLTGVTDLVEILAVYWQEPDTTLSWPSLRPSEYRLKRDANTTDFPSGYGLMIYNGGSQGRPVRVTYSTGFNTVTALTDNISTTTGLPDTAQDIIPLGAAARLVGVQETKRNTTGSQRDPRRAEEVPAGAIIGAARYLLAERQRRLDQERARLLKDFPIRVR